MLINGFLHKNIHGEWIVVEGENYWHPYTDHSMWLKVFGEEGLEVCFEIDENNHAILKACGPDTHEYVQD